MKKPASIVALPSAAGVYAILHAKSGKRYVGSAKNIRHRCWLHYSDLMLWQHHSYRLQKAWDAHGGSEFEFVVVELLPADKAVLIEREQHWIDFYEAANPFKGLNIRLLAESNLGLKRRPETIERLTARHASRTKAEKAAIAAKCSALTNKTSGVMGVSYLPSHKAWRAKVKRGGKTIHLGLFETMEEARDTRRAWDETGVAVKKTLQRNNSSGVVGVWFDKKRKKWVAVAKRSMLGRFTTKEEAVAARMAWEMASVQVLPY